MNTITNYDDMGFSPRNQLKNKYTINTNMETNYDYLIQQVKQLDLDVIDFEHSDYNKINLKIDKQKVYFWIRVYLSEETKIEPGDVVNITHTPTEEELETTFICYAKKGVGHIDYEDGEPVVTNYNAEDDTKCLCLMVDEDRINYDSDDIPFIRKLFKIGRHYEYELIRRSELILTNQRNDEQIEYYDIEF
jgi:hypothetical protein